MKLAIGADHGGYQLKEEIKKMLDEKGIAYHDFGTYSEASVDYPVIAAKVGHAIVDGEYDRGILVCGTGIGISIAANKVKGIRAAVCADEYCAEYCRRHNNANILCLGGRVLTVEKGLKLVDIYLNTEFEGGRHERRVNMFTELEEGRM